MHEVIKDPVADLAYLQKKLDECLKSNSIEECDKIRKQTELLLDSILIYRLDHPRGTSLSLYPK